VTARPADPLRPSAIAVFIDLVAAGGAFGQRHLLQSPAIFSICMLKRFRLLAKNYEQFCISSWFKSVSLEFLLL